jgi:hypothetical protein
MVPRCLDGQRFNLNRCGEAGPGKEGSFAWEAAKTNARVPMFRATIATLRWLLRAVGGPSGGCRWDGPVRTYDRLDHHLEISGARRDMLLQFSTLLHESFFSVKRRQREKAARCRTAFRNFPNRD